jgi:hypothetical protein
VHPCRIADEPTLTGQALGVEQIPYRRRRHTIGIERGRGFGAWMFLKKIKGLFCDSLLFFAKIGVFHAMMGPFRIINNETHNESQIKPLI